MKKINDTTILVNDIPKSFKGKKIGEGSSGTCYLTKDGTLVYKELENDLIDKFNMKEFTKIKSDLIAFPRTIIYQNEVSDDNILGYLRDYIEGKFIFDVDEEESIKSIIYASDKIEKELKNISKKGILVEDINRKNVLYTKQQEFKLIDTDLYDYTISEEPYDIYRANIKEWGNFIMYELGSNYPYQNENLNEYYLRLIFQGKVHPSYLMNYMINEMKKQTGYEIQTLGEYREGQKLIKKL